MSSAATSSRKINATDFDRLVNGLDAVPWFAVVGQALTSREEDTAGRYLGALGFDDLSIRLVLDLAGGGSGGADMFGAWWWGNFE